MPDIEMSPSSRRAWIEILTLWPNRGAGIVALLAEGVDRNTDPENTCPAWEERSPSSRRAWIEMMKFP